MIDRDVDFLGSLDREGDRAVLVEWLEAMGRATPVLIPVVPAISGDSLLFRISGGKLHLHPEMFDDLAAYAVRQGRGTGDSPGDPSRN